MAFSSPRRQFRQETRTVTFTRPGEIIVHDERLIAPRRDQALVRSHLSLISPGTELICLTGDFSPNTHWGRWVQYPFKPGYSLVGVVERRGRDVPRQLVGKRVVGPAPHGATALLSEPYLIPVPDDISDSAATFSSLASIGQLGVSRCSIEKGTTAVVIGAGIVGQLTAQLARAAGAYVTVVARSPAKLELAERLGASATIPLNAAEAVATVRDVTQEAGADVVFDASGDPAVLAPALRMLRRFGRLVLLGDPGYPAQQHVDEALLLNGLEIVGAHYDHADVLQHRELAREFFELLRGGVVNVDPLAQVRVKPEEAAAAYEALARRDDERIGFLFDWQEQS